MGDLMKSSQVLFEAFSGKTKIPSDHINDHIERLHITKAVFFDKDSNRVEKEVFSTMMVHTPNGCHHDRTVCCYIDGKQVTVGWIDIASFYFTLSREFISVSGHVEIFNSTMPLSLFKS